jgi:hypothetical protein
MFTLGYELCMNRGFEAALQKLCSHPFTDGKKLYNASKIVRRYREMVKSVINETKVLAETYGKKDDKGKLVMAEGLVSAYQIIDGKEEEHKAAQDILLSKFCKFDCHQFSLSDCVEAKLNPTEVADLEPMLLIED